MVESTSVWYSRDAEMDDLEPRPMSKALPVAVGGGLAVAVFGILLAVRSGDVPAKPPVGPTDTPVEKPTDKPPAAAPAPAGAPKAVVTASAPDAAPKQVASAGAPDAPKAAADTPKQTTLTFAVTPPDAVVKVNGKSVTGGKVSLQTGEYKVKVEVSAPGYLLHDEEVGMAKDATVTVELKKEVAATKPPPPQTPKQPKEPPVHKPPIKK